MRHIGKLTDLEAPSLVGASVSDESLAVLAGLHRLWLLDLSSTSVGEAGLEHLAKLMSLGAVRLGGKRVTKQGVARLQAALPTTLIVSDFPTGNS